MFKGKLFVVKTQQMEDRGMKVIHVHGVFNDVVSEIICLPMNNSRANSAACHPDGVVSWMMITSVVIFSEISLAVICPAEFASPNYQRFLQQSTLFKIQNECSRCAVHILSLERHVSDHIIMLIPALV